MTLPERMICNIWFFKRADLAVERQLGMEVFMKNKRVPLRQCTGCGEMKSKKEMLRIIKTPEDEIVIDTTGKKNGRGAYICNSQECFLKAVKSKALERSLRISIPKEIYDTLEEELKKIEC